MRHLLHILSIITLSCQAQTDTVDHYFPYLVTGDGKIGGSYSWNRPLRMDDTIRYKIIVDDPKSLATITNKDLGITYKFALILDSAYAIWVPEDSMLGPHWEIFEPFKHRRLRDLNIRALKIDEYPKPKPSTFIWTP